MLTVTTLQRLGLRPVADWFADQVETCRVTALPARTRVWHRLSAGEGAKRPRLSDWARVPYRGAAPSFEGALLVRRSRAEPRSLTFYLIHAPEGTTLATLVRVAGSRWTIESGFEQAKGEVGLISMRCDRGRAGTATSPWRCSPTPCSPPCAGRPWGESRRQARWRIHGQPSRHAAAAHRARGAPPAGRDHRPAAAQHRRDAAMVGVATAPSAACPQSAPDAADTRQTQT